MIHMQQSGFLVTNETKLFECSENLNVNISLFFSFFTGNRIYSHEDSRRYSLFTTDGGHVSQTMSYFSNT